MNRHIQEIEFYLASLEELQNKSNHVSARLRQAELTGERSTCRLCKKRLAMFAMAQNFLNEQLEQHIMFRLPPMAKHF